MFFEEGNCRAFRLLQEASNFLEASLEKLLELENEALSEINENINKTEVNVIDNTVKKISLKTNTKNGNGSLNSVSLTTVPDNIETICNCGTEFCEHKLSYKIRMSSSIETQSVELQNPCKRKLESMETMPINEDDTNSFCTGKQNKKRTNGRNMCEKDSEMLLPNINLNEEMIDTVEPNTCLLKDNLSDKINDNSITNQCQKQIVSEPNEETLIETYYKVCIKFKESLPYETVEELIKSVGFDDVFDVVLTKKSAEVTFLNENSMKKALNLSQDDLIKLKAYFVLPVKKQKIKCSS